jgi:hypothetical protein
MVKGPHSTLSSPPDGKVCIKLKDGGALQGCLSDVDTNPWWRLQLSSAARRSDARSKRDRCM